MFVSLFLPEGPFRCPSWGDSWEIIGVGVVVYEAMVVLCSLFGFIAVRGCMLLVDVAFGLGLGCPFGLGVGIWHFVIKG